MARFNSSHHLRFNKLMRGFRKQIMKKRRKLLNKPMSDFNMISEKNIKLKRLSKNELNDKQLRQQLTKPVRKRRLERQSSMKLSSLLERLKRLSLKLRSKNRLILTLQSENQSVQLQLLQSNSRSSHVTDPRDKVFSILGISDEGLDPSLALTQIMSTSGTNTALSLYRRAASSIARHINDLGPGLDVLRHKALQPNYNKDVVEVYRDLTRFLIRKSPRVLSVLAHVQHTDDPAQSYYPSWVPKWFQPRQCSVLDGLTKEKFIRQGEADAAVFLLSKILVDDTILITYGPEKLSLLDRLCSLVTMELGEAGADPERFERGARSVCFHPRFYVTEKGYLGIGPRMMSPGDEVCVLFGGRVPFILRRMADYHLFIGDTYINDDDDDDAMWGKITEGI
ncbi:hypothetical protein ACO22_02568 [Paracoccidioides brasiliensis]|uniref:Uncharacterized protein n=1 Tax=Paracoccidioides brasiliensis TaxID=121759 RepID=A0A1D2JIC2_PARBR|nr:hypothetical protein ACO22_02568 [Paracoccidioides brasiliensis]